MNTERYIPQLYPCFQHWAKWDNIWIIGDLHAGDLDQETFFGGWQTDEIIEKINKVVSRKDMLIILGDLGKAFRQLGRIRAGYKVLCTGNHDGGTKKFRRQIYTKKFDADKYTKAKAMKEMRELYLNKFAYYHISAEECWNVLHTPFHYWEYKADNKLFDEIYDGPICVGPKLILSHEAVDIPWAMNLHGHHHSLDWKNDENHICLCGEKVDYQPLNLKQWIKKGGLSKIPHIHELTIEKAKAKKASEQND